MLKKPYAKACEKAMKQHSASFYQAFRELPSPRKEAVFVIYTFCRMIDDSMDEPENSVYTLDELEWNFQHLSKAEGHFIWPSLRWLFDTFPNLEPAPFFTQIKGQRMDEKHTHYKTFEQLEEYCYHVAGSVGEMLLPVLHDYPSEKIVQAGIKLGKAMQIVNILRDVGEDLERGRRYIPLSILSAYDYSEEAFYAQELSLSFRQVIDDLINTANGWFEEGMEGLNTYPESSAFAITLASSYYAAIMDVIKENDYDVFHKRAYVTQSRKLALYQTAKKARKRESIT
ncbi:phytoene/squalene synthase family protein [Terribacillus saccharophilus]|uniref:phytoene/squalene synthase family protein n=1 Tax=Terribacillus saccharophilus TaxID=361277 RepID=UPI00298A0718|nr:phytoene/squalene synthase family protein [Terribacillus saccharophilus]MCM3224682.1 phytoene/squalene synthase family protein [Terribacillus saccharophilus]